MDTFRSIPSSLSSLEINLIASPKVRAKTPELSISPTFESTSFLAGTPPSFPPLPESPTARSRRSPSPSKTPQMNVFSTSLEHILDVWLPTQLLPEMVTVSAKKGSKLDIVADIWHQEKDSHYEWEITFPPRDVDMSSIRVDLANGHLTIRAWRMQRRSSTV